MKRKTMVIAGLTMAAGLAAWPAIHAARMGKERTGMVNKSTPILHVKSC